MLSETSQQVMLTEPTMVRQQMTTSSTAATEAEMCVMVDEEENTVYGNIRTAYY